MKKRTYMIFPCWTFPYSGTW